MKKPAIVRFTIQVPSASSQKPQSQLPVVSLHGSTTSGADQLTPPSVERGKQRLAAVVMEGETLLVEHRDQRPVAQRAGRHLVDAVGVVAMDVVVGDVLEAAFVP